MAQNSSADYYDDDFDENSAPAKKSGVGMVILIIGIMFIVGICVLGFLAALIMPALMKARTQAGKTKCTNNLRGIGIASILYSNDRRFFPHMTSSKKEHSKEQINDVYRTLVQGKYIDNAEVYICPNSNDYALQGNPAIKRGKT
ncbi:MAG: hypothetical protein P1V97_37595, partial [Planctomycetota bacterium]|nr:hypothetical protein [Planctomycetota bacterium]